MTIDKRQKLRKCEEENSNLVKTGHMNPKKKASWKLC